MAAIEESLRDIPVRIQTSSSKEREDVFSNLQHFLNKEDLPDGAITAISQLLPLTLPRYNDSKSRSLVEQLIVSLARRSPQEAVTLLTTTFSNVAHGVRRLYVTSNLSRTCLTALRWLCAVIRGTSRSIDLVQDQDFTKLVESVSILLGVVLAAKNVSHVKKAQKQLGYTFRQAPCVLEKFLQTLLKLEPTYQTVALSSFIVKHLDDNKDVQRIDQFKNGFLDHFIKTVISSKNKPPLYVLEFSVPLLKHVNHDDFRTALLPAMQKALLRCPEIILRGVAEVVASLCIDLSQYTMELGKTLGTCLSSKEETIREDAALAIRNLSRRCSDVQPMEKLFLHIVSILNGSEGKLVVSAQKVSVITGMGNLSCNTIPASSAQSLAFIATREFVKILETEILEGILVHTLAMLSLWCKSFSTDVPRQLIDWFKKAIGLKSSTPLVRNAYLTCMESAFHDNTLSHGEELIPILLKAVEKAATHPASNIVVTEGLTASALLLRLAASNRALEESSLGSFWNVILDLDKQFFISEKFLLAASDEALGSLVLLFERMFLDFPEKFKDDMSLYYRAIVFVLTRPSISVRRHASIVVKKLLSTFSGGRLSVSLQRAFSEFIHNKNTKVIGIESGDVITSNGVGTQGSSEVGVTVAANVAVECLWVLCSVSGLDQVDCENILIECISGSHHPDIVAARPSLWTSLAQRLNADPVTILKSNLNVIWAKILDCVPLTPTYGNVIKTLVKLCPNQTLPLLVSHVKERLTSSDLANITKEEYGIFATPLDKVYDVSAVDSNVVKVVESKNVKRESKLYSHKEQLEDLQLKKELEAKKKGKGEKEEPQLSRKQIEMMQAQLAKEAVTRERVLQLKLGAVHAISMAEAAIKGNPNAFQVHCRDVVEGLLSALRCSIAAVEANALYVLLQSCVMDGNLHNLGKQVCHITLRLFEPSCELDLAWNQEKLVTASTRIVRVLHKTTVRPVGEIYNEMNDSLQQPLSSPAFSYTFPLLNLILRNRGQKLNIDESTVVKSLEVIAEHAQMRAIPGIEKNELSDPSFLPIKQMLDLLVYLLESTPGNIRNLSGRVLLQVADSASGHPGCATASPDEIKLLLLGLLIPIVEARNFALLSLMSLSDILRKISHLSNEPPILRRLFVTRFDPDDNNRELVEKLWSTVGLEETPDLCQDLLSDISYPQEFVRSSAAEGLASLLSRFPKKASQMLDSLMDIYHDALDMPPPVLDGFGRVISEAPVDKWEPRSGVAVALKHIVAKIPESIVSNLTKFLYEGFGDRNMQVQQEMLDAALELVNVHGKDNVGTLLPLFENFLDKTPKSSDYDSVRQSVVVLMGALARHLEKNDPKVQPIVAKLIETLSTPSQQVQEAVANCLPPLVPSIQDDAPDLVKKLLHKLVSSDSYGVRRGAAYGLAGLVKGLGILSLKQLGIMTSLNEAINNKKKSKSREGALLAFEMLCHMLGRLFEPYVVHILPTMLICFGDGDQYVRRAAEDTAKSVMSHLSVHGVKMVLPVLLKGLEENNWRTKVGSVELLGSMAFCAPKQLSSCLPNIVPKLIEILADSHAKVQQAGAQALRQIGAVIKNPEIQALVIVLLQALEDPAKKTAVCLQTLLNTKFVHFIDSPSLALIMPVVQRAFQNRSTETRKMAAEIIGNMYSVTDKKDLAPYLPNVVPGLKQSLLDPVPEVRCVAARALGTMVKGMGEGIYDELLPWLMQTLTSEASSVDRSGAAQGLSEVVGGQGIETLHKLMPNIIATANRSDIAPHVKDGYIMTFIYMPVVFQQEFTPYIGQIINPILKALADESEFVRETAFRAGQRIVNMYAESAITLLLPELEQGLFDDNWRIRYSSVQLLGDLLYKISGVSGKMSTETANEDDNFGTEHSHKAILLTLGRDRRNRVLAGLYMGRSDIALMVRQSALHVWKIVVANTPRTLREILPTLFSLLLGCLASTSYDKRQVAARTLGDLVRKLGERVLPDIIPILERGLESDQSDQRQGVCIGLSEIMASTSKEMVMSFVDSLVPTVRKALCDPLPEVRKAAAKTFDSLHNTVGNRALDDILSPLLKQLGSTEVGEYTLDGLRQVMAVKSRVVLPYLIPQLTSPPVNTKALSILASVAGDALNKHLGKILPALLLALSESYDTPDEQVELEYCQAVVLSVSDSSGVHTIIDELLEATKNKNIGVRRAATTLLFSYCSQTKADYRQHVPQLLRGLIYLFIDEDERILQLAWEALNAVTKDLDANEHLQHVANVRQAVRFVASDLGPNQLLPGFCLPKGISSILPIFREAILNGSPELKEQAATGLGEVIRLTNAEALKPSVVNITGPLIRVLGDRFPSDVRVAVLETLALLLSKVGTVLKPFLPQLQTTFLKALSDPSRQVRLKAATALSKLIVIHTKADPLFTELHTNVRNLDDTSIRETMLQALRSIISPAGDKMSDSVRKSILSSLQNMLGVGEDTTRLAVAGCLGVICKTLPDDELSSIVNNVLTGTNSSLDWTVRHGRCAALMVALKEAPSRILTEQWTDSVIKALTSYLTADKVPIVLSGIRGVGVYLKHQILINGSISQPLVQILSKLMNHSSNEVKQLVAQVGSYLANSVPEGLPDVVVKPLIPMLVNGTKEKNSVVKANSEFALVAILQLRSTGDEMQQKCIKLLDVGAREALSDVITKVLRKVANQPEPKEEELDDTLLT